MRRCWGGSGGTSSSDEQRGLRTEQQLSPQHSVLSTELRARDARRRRARAARCSAAAFARSEGRTRDGGRDTDGFCVLEVRVDRSDDDARFNRDQIDADEGDTNPRVDDDTFVEDPVQYVNKTCA